MDLEEVRHTTPFLSEEYKSTLYCNYRKQCIYPEKKSTTETKQKIKQTKQNLQKQHILPQERFSAWLYYYLHFKLSYWQFGKWRGKNWTSNQTPWGDWHYLLLFHVSFKKFWGLRCKDKNVDANGHSKSRDFCFLWIKPVLRHLKKFYLQNCSTCEGEK